MSAACRSMSSALRACQGSDIWLVRADIWPYRPTDIPKGNAWGNTMQR